MKARATTIVASLLFVFAALGSSAEAASSQAPLGDSNDVVVTSFAGHVDVTAAAARLALDIGRVVPLPARIVTGNDGSLGIAQAATQISVAADSEIEIPAEVVDGQLIARLVQRRGNVFYDVAKREAGKLRVETPFLVAVIKGTQFNVSVQPDSTTISLFEGLLEIRTPDDSEVIQLNAGEIAIRGRSDTTIRIVGMNDERVAVPRPASANDAAGAAALANDIAATVPSTLSLGAGTAGVGVDASVRAPNVGIHAATDIGADGSPTVAAKVDTNLGTAGADLGVAVNTDLGAGSVDASLGAGLGLGGASVDAGAGVALDVGSGSVGANLGAGLDLGGTTVNAGADVGVDLGGGSVDLGLDASLDLGGTTVDVGADVGVDLGGGSVDLGLDAGLDLGGTTADLGADLGVDLGGGSVDLGLDTGLDLGGTTADLGADLGVDLGSGGLDVGLDTGLDLGGATADLGTDLGVDLGVDLGGGGIDLGDALDPVIDLTPPPPAGGGGGGGGGLGGLLGRIL